MQDPEKAVEQYYKSIINAYAEAHKYNQLHPRPTDDTRSSVKQVGFQEKGDRKMSKKVTVKTSKTARPISKNIPAIGKKVHGYCGACKTGVDFKVKEVRKTSRVRVCGACPKCHKTVARGF